MSRFLPSRFFLVCFAVRDHYLSPPSDVTFLVPHGSIRELFYVINAYVNFDPKTVVHAAPFPDRSGNRNRLLTLLPSFPTPSVFFLLLIFTSFESWAGIAMYDASVVAFPTACDVRTAITVY